MSLFNVFQCENIVLDHQEYYVSILLDRQEYFVSIVLLRQGENNGQYLPG